MYYTYVLYSKAYNKIYIGQTDNLESRIKEHNSGLSNYTRKYKPWEIIYFEEFRTRAEAMKREEELKSHKGREFIRKAALNGGVWHLSDSRSQRDDEFSGTLCDLFLFFR